LQDAEGIGYVIPNEEIDPVHGEPQGRPLRGQALRRTMSNTAVQNESLRGLLS